MSSIIFIENPLMDLSREFTNDDILKKYELQHGQASLASEKQLPLYKELFESSETEFIPGGSTLNTCRSTNFILNQPSVCQYFGCIGQDEMGDLLEKKLQEVNITSTLCRDQETPTGTCACIIIKNERTLCANLAACLKFPTQYLQERIQQLNTAKFMYTSAFFITSNFEALMLYAKHANEQNIPLGFNLSALFLIQFNLNQILEVLPYVDYLFCNDDEGRAFAETQGWTEDELVMNLVYFRKINENRPRVAIVTYGAKQVRVGQASGEQSYPVQALEQSQIVDTNGAGDSFVGGFISQIYKGENIERAVRVGMALAREVVMRSGCTFPETLEL